jgi:hypothetical protein
MPSAEQDRRDVSNHLAADNLLYQVGEDTVWILALVHTARQWPPER